MTEAEAAWVAGLLEGEGCFQGHVRKDKGYRTFNIQCNMTDQDTIEKLQHLTGTGSVKSCSTPKQPNRKPQWRWRVDKKFYIYYLLKQIRPWMLSRRGAIIDEMLRNIEAVGVATHGTQHMYVRYRCRCRPCTEAAVAAVNKYRNKETIVCTEAHSST